MTTQSPTLSKTDIATRASSVEDLPVRRNIINRIHREASIRLVLHQAQDHPISPIGSCVFSYFAFSLSCLTDEWSRARVMDSPPASGYISTLNYYPPSDPATSGTTGPTVTRMLKLEPPDSHGYHTPSQFRPQYDPHEATYNPMRKRHACPYCGKRLMRLDAVKRHVISRQCPVAVEMNYGWPVPENFVHAMPLPPAGKVIPYPREAKIEPLEGTGSGEARIIAGTRLLTATS